ncbi:MAG: amino acid ABC transporter substrate-binding protein [Alphaproteobacteria bacterium]|nr:amino acid ABC transporter substrate-binding protein [Alphaproteobacteria bacterium]
MSSSLKRLFSAISTRIIAAFLCCAAFAVPPADAADANIPVLVPITGFLSLEGTSQRNGAVLALENPPAEISVTYDVADTSTAPEVAVNALERALADGDATAVAASMFGPQMLAMIPLADRHGVPLVTVSGTAKITELGSPWVFRFFPGDTVAKVAQVDYAVNELGITKPAMIYQTTAYGQSGAAHIGENLRRLGIAPVLEEGLDVKVKDMTPVLAKARAAGADALLLQLHSGPTALLVRAAAAGNLGLPIVAGSAMHQPSTAALLDPGELDGVCAESASSPISGGTPEMDAWLERYRAAFGTEPDAFALGQYDGTMMVLSAIAAGARSPAEVRDYLAGNSHDGLAMTYRSDGSGNMAHSAIIVCYDGETRIPRVVKVFDNVTGALD